MRSDVVSELLFPLPRQANDMVLARGRDLESFFPSFSNHWSRLDGCDAYKGYLQERITRDVVSHDDCAS